MMVSKPFLSKNASNIPNTKPAMLPMTCKSVIYPSPFATHVIWWSRAYPRQTWPLTMATLSLPSHAPISTREKWTAPRTGHTFRSRASTKKQRKRRPFSGPGTPLVIHCAWRKLVRPSSARMSINGPCWVWSRDPLHPRTSARRVSSILLM